ncbi:hypothetical protein Nepgr_019136 [Nepenthes gracilis]|uniref:Uncharacterized protein n=1 Tax=Nepenthes gracilis TaxID=150966 RepID=A0AAD3XUY0_NEPGR|nr:hypothetical protein Nepgr_019136 [Nepenthes gracilis]
MTMARTTKERYHGHKVVEKEEQDNIEDLYYTQPNAHFLFELNLLMVIASLTLTPEELLQFEEMEIVSFKYQEITATISKIQNRKRELSDFKVADRRALKSQTKIMHSRHGRKM